MWSMTQAALPTEDRSARLPTVRERRIRLADPRILVRTWRTQSSKFQCQPLYVCPELFIAQPRIAQALRLQRGRYLVAAAGPRVVFPLADSILHGLRARGGKASLDRTRSWSSVRGASLLARMAAFAGMSFMPQLVHLMIRSFFSSSVGSH